MKVLQVIHGYPMRYNAGSEVYTQGLCQALAHRHEVHVFTRQENAFLPEYELQRETDPSDPQVALHVINMARARDGYSHREVDDDFAGLLDELRPDVVHVGHLNHLSTSLVFPAKHRGIPVVFTLHDYWLMCPRGQFIQMYEDQGQQPWPVCDGQEDRKCAVRCYRRYFGNDDDEFELDAAHQVGENQEPLQSGSRYRCSRPLGFTSPDGQSAKPLLLRQGPFLLPLRRAQGAIRGKPRLNRGVDQPGGSYCAALSLHSQADKNRTPEPARRRAPGPEPAAAGRPPPIRAGRFAPGIRDSRSGSRHCRDADLTV